MRFKKFFWNLYVLDILNLYVLDILNLYVPAKIFFMLDGGCQVDTIFSYVNFLYHLEIILKGRETQFSQNWEKEVT